jgi:hypothetical protein
MLMRRRSDAPACPGPILLHLLRASQESRGSRKKLNDATKNTCSFCKVAHAHTDACAERLAALSNEPLPPLATDSPRPLCTATRLTSPRSGDQSERDRRRPVGKKMADADGREKNPDSPRSGARRTRPSRRACTPSSPWSSSRTSSRIRGSCTTCPASRGTARIGGETSTTVSRGR